MRILDLCCGAGGASMGLHRAFPDAEIVGVDIAPQPRYPFTFVLGDAMTYPLDDFDYVWASPPCQSFSAYRRKGHGVGDGYPNLIPQIRERLVAWGGPYTIENVPRAPLLNPIQLCGSSFDLDVRRHRWFENNFPVEPPPCDHGWQTPRFPPATNRTNFRKTVEVGVWRIPLEVQRRAMDIDWMELEELSEAIPPAYSEYVGRALMAASLARLSA